MKLKKVIILFVTFILSGSFIRSIAQDTAPASMLGKTAVAVISSGSGIFAPIGGYRIAFSASNATYSVSPLSATVDPSAGTYIYTKLGPNTARLKYSSKCTGCPNSETR